MSTELLPADRVADVSAYRVPSHPAPVDLDLRGNEGAIPDLQLLRGLDGVPLLRQYPDSGPLRRRLAGRFGVEKERVLVTAGGDDALDRLCRAVLQPGRTLLLPSPGFEMTRRYALLAGADVVEVPWPAAAFPLRELLSLLGPETGLVALTSPNNPTGAVIPEDTIDSVCRAAADVGAVVLLDLAYVEFASFDPTEAMLRHDNVVVVRTVSKAWGLAGIRVGYAIGPAEVISWMTAAGAPYSVSAPSLALAESALERGDDDMRAFAAGVEEGRRELSRLLEQVGCSVVPGEANFVFARSDRADWIADGLAGLGVAVRTFPTRPGLENALRIAIPPTVAGRTRLSRGLAAAALPQALIFDMDGVLVDVSRSYREAIVATARHHGAVVTASEISDAKAAGDSNNDWVLSWRLLRGAGKQVPLQVVTDTFENFYQGTDEALGLWTREKLIASTSLLHSLSTRVRLAVVTGRPRQDAERLLKNAGWSDLFDVVVCMEDAPAKPDPTPVLQALKLMDVERAWMIGDTPDDIRAARSAGVVPVGIESPGEASSEALFRAGAARVLTSLTELLELMP